MSIADEQGLDLIEIAPMATPPVCRIMDYQKFQYQQRKRLKEQKAKATKVVVKEIRFGPQTDDHDYEFKLKHAIGFLKEGAKVKSYVFFKGRSILRLILKSIKRCDMTFKELLNSVRFEDVAPHIVRMYPDMGQSLGWYKIHFDMLRLMQPVFMS